MTHTDLERSTFKAAVNKETPGFEGVTLFLVPVALIPRTVAIPRRLGTSISSTPSIS